MAAPGARGAFLAGAAGPVAGLIGTGELARELSADASAAFVNGLLARIAELGPFLQV